MNNNTPHSSKLDHGGQLRTAARQYGIPLAEWLDLSTGISPWSYPFTPPSRNSWQRLPEPDDGLFDSARNYYKTDSLLPLPGSQAAISLLPLLRAPGHVLLLGPTYNEHGHRWRQAGHRVDEYEQLPGPKQLSTTNVLVVVNPNNPTGRLLAPNQLLKWYDQLPPASWMVVDEAFIDSRPEFSLLPSINPTDHSRLVVLRSLGKFFGLAGSRVGFALGAEPLLARLEDKLLATLGSWSVNGPAREVATQALADQPWQKMQRQRLTHAGQRLANLLADLGHPADGQSDFFCWVKTCQSQQWQQSLARQGIWCRRFAQPSAIRLGLPANESEWLRLEHGLINLFSGSNPQSQSASPMPTRSPV